MFLTICDMGCQVGAQLRSESGMCSSLMLLNVFVLEWVFLSLWTTGNPPSNPIAPPVPTSFSPVHFDFTSAQPNTSHCVANSTSQSTFVVQMSNGTVDATSWLVSCDYQGPWAPLCIVCVATINSDSDVCMYVCIRRDLQLIGQSLTSLSAASMWMFHLQLSTAMVLPNCLHQWQCVEEVWSYKYIIALTGCSFTSHGVFSLQE